MSRSHRDPTRTTAEVISVGRELHEAGLVAGVAGNLSALLGDERMLITVAGSHLGRLDTEDLVETSLSGQVDASARVSSELPFHRAAYRADRRVRGVVHVHAPALIAIGLRGYDIEDALPEVGIATGSIVVIEPTESGSEELGRKVGEAVALGGRVILLHRHGAVAVGSTLRDAADRIELAELSAYAVLLAENEGQAITRRRLRRLTRRLTERLAASA
jgi:ribulose-5-phosphate 4-epimerase/fuculose-1-phosphate aldolase